MRRLLHGFLAFLGWLAITLVGWTLRIRSLRGSYRPGGSATGPTLLAFEHGRQFTLLAHFARLRNKRIALMSSASRDGRIQAGILSGLGYRVVLGSSSRRGAAGLVAMLRAVRREGCDAALAVDGPRGPVGSVKPGLAYIASRTGGTIVPVSAACRPAHAFRNSWCGYRLPWPFAAAVVAFGDPIRVPPKADPIAIAAACDAVRAELQHLARQCDGALGVAAAEESPSAA